MLARFGFLWAVSPAGFWRGRSRLLLTFYSFPTLRTRDGPDGLRWTDGSVRHESQFHHRIPGRGGRGWRMGTRVVTGPSNAAGDGISPNPPLVALFASSVTAREHIRRTPRGNIIICMEPIRGSWRWTFPLGRISFFSFATF